MERRYYRLDHWNRLTVIAGLMKKSGYIFVLLFLFLTVNLFAGAKKTVKDGTFLLRQKKEQLDYQLKKKFLSDPTFRKNVIGGNRTNLVLGNSEVGFQVYNFTVGGYEYKPGIFMAEGKFCRIFLEKKNLGIWGHESEKVLNQIVATFDNRVYPSVTSWFGEPFIPDEFSLSDNKIFIFLVDVQDNFAEGYVAGYFDHRDIDGLFGNQKPLFFMDINPGEPGNASDKANSFYRTLAHEFQHMVSFSRRIGKKIRAQERWLDEGLSMYSEFIFSGQVGENTECLPPSPHFERFIEDPDVNIFSNSNDSWFKEVSLYRQYGASFLFATYLIEKFGGETLLQKQKFTRDIIEIEKPGAEGLDSFLAANGSSLQDVFNNWVMACYLNDETLLNGKWYFPSIRTISDATVPQLPLKKVRHFYTREESSFVGAEGSIPPNSVNLEEISGDGKINLKFTFEKTMNPSLVNIYKDKTVGFRTLNLNDDGQAEVALNLDELDKAMVLPVGVKTQFAPYEKMRYSFSSTSRGLLLYPLPNPAFPDQFIIILRSMEQPIIATPSLKISFNNLIDSPAFSPVDQDKKLFVAHYRIPGTGKGQAICYSGDDSCSFSFSAATLRGSDSQEATAGNARLVISSIESSRSVSGMISIPIVADVPKGVDVLDGPFDIILTENSSATLILKGNKVSEGGIGICALNEVGQGVNWNGTNVSENSLSASVTRSGRYYLVKDSESPTLKNLVILNSRNGCQIRAELHDKISGINQDKVTISIDGREVRQRAFSDGELHCFSIPELAGGEHEFELRFEDNAGNQLTEMRSQVLVGNVYLAVPEVFPNPCKVRATIKFNFSAAINLIASSIKIYDCSGELVESISGNQSAPNQVEAVWSARNKSGRKVANGAYLAKIRIQTAQGVFKSRCKIAVVQ